MDMTVYPGALSGHLNAPSSATILSRMVAASALCLAPSTLFYDTPSRDAEVISRALGALGCSVRQNGIRIAVGPLPFGALPRDAEIDLSDSAEALGLLLPLCCVLKYGALLRGARYFSRSSLALALAELSRHGARFSSDTLPLKVDGGLKPGEYHIDGPFAQSLACGLLLILPLMNGTSLLSLQKAQLDSDALDMTAYVLSLCQVHVLRGPDGFVVPGGQRYAALETHGVEGDWAYAAPWLALSKVYGGVSVGNLNPHSAQAARRTEGLFEKLGGSLDVSDCPGLLPSLALAAAFYQGRTRFLGVLGGGAHRADTAETLAAAFSALGCAFSCADGVLTVDGISYLSGGRADCAGSPEISAVLALAATRASSAVELINCGDIERAYPDFLKRLKALGGKVETRGDSSAKTAAN